MRAVLLLDSEDTRREMLRETLYAQGFEVDETRDPAAAVAALTTAPPLALIVNLEAAQAHDHAVLVAAQAADPDLPVVVTIAPEQIGEGMLAIRRGAYALLPRPTDPELLRILMRRARAQRMRIDACLLHADELHDRLAFPRILGSSPVLVETMRRIRALALTGTPVLLVGEPGTGRELFARAIHHLSARSQAPFLRVAGSQLPELERLDPVRRGTLFIDGIDTSEPVAHARLTAILDATGPRVVASAQRESPDLAPSFSRGLVSVPPLRARDGDIPLLATHFLSARDHGDGGASVRFSGESLELLRAYPWPGNVRELELCVQRARMLAEGELIEPRHLAVSQRPSPVR